MGSKSLNLFADAAVPLIYVATSAAVKLALWARGDKTMQAVDKLLSVGRVTGLSIYPVKSLDGMRDLQEAECTFTGVKLPGVDLYDRQYLLTVGDDFRFVTARQCPTLLLVKAGFENNRLYFDAPGMERLVLPIVQRTEGNSERVATKVWGLQVYGWDCGPEVSDWFTRYLASPDRKGPAEQYRLLYNPGVELPRISRKPHLHVNDLKPVDQLAYHDDGPFLLVSETSFDELSRRLESNNVNPPIGITYFRPTITISGENAPPFDEDTWNEVFIGDAKFTVFMPCARCLLTTIDPNKGEVRADGEPLKTLRSFRVIQWNNTSPCFGTYLVCDRPAAIRVGDPVYVLKKRPSWP